MFYGANDYKYKNLQNPQHFFFQKRDGIPLVCVFRCGRSLMVILQGQCQATLTERTSSQPSRTDLSQALRHITS